MIPLNTLFTRIIPSFKSTILLSKTKFHCQKVFSFVLVKCNLFLFNGLHFICFKLKFKKIQIPLKVKAICIPN